MERSVTEHSARADSFAHCRDRSDAFAMAVRARCLRVRFWTMDVAATNHEECCATPSMWLDEREAASAFDCPVVPVGFIARASTREAEGEEEDDDEAADETMPVSGCCALPSRAISDALEVEAMAVLVVLRGELLCNEMNVLESKMPVIMGALWIGWRGILRASRCRV